MDNEILTGKKINDARNNTTDEAVDEILKKAQEQLDRDMGDMPEVTAKKKEAQERIKKEQAERAAKARLEQARLSKEKAERQRLAREKAEQERIAKEKAEQERVAREQAEQERIAKEKAEQERVAREKAEQERIAKEKAERAALERIEQQRIEKERAERKRIEQEKQERFEREKAEQERIKKEQERQERQESEKKKAKQEKIEREQFAKDIEMKEKVGKELARYDKNSVSGDTKRINIPVTAGNNNSQSVSRIEGRTGDNAGGKHSFGKPSPENVMSLEDEVIVDNSVPAPIRKEGITAGDVIGGFLEFVWTIFKIAVVVCIVTGIVGFFLSREMLIRGRNGNLKCLNDMQPSQTAITNKDIEKEENKEWIKSVKPQKLTLESDDGYILVARQVVINKDGDNWVVILHGYNGAMEDVYDIARKYTEAQYNVLMPDLRASGESEGSFIGMGWLDRLDVINWIDVILADNPSAKVIIHGVDMGADTGLMISGEPIKSNIKGIVADGAYTSAWDVMQKEFKTRHEKWPVFPLMETVNPVAKIWGGYSLREASAVDQVAKTSVPILLIHGGMDTYVTEEMTNELNGAVASSHKLINIPAGTHDDCRYADPASYYNEVFDFVNAHMK